MRGAEKHLVAVTSVFKQDIFLLPGGENLVKESSGSGGGFHQREQREIGFPQRRDKLLCRIEQLDPFGVESGTAEEEESFCIGGQMFRDEFRNRFAEGARPQFRQEQGSCREEGAEQKEPCETLSFRVLHKYLLYPEF